MLTAANIGADEDKIGLKNSSTQVVNLSYPTVTRKGKIVSGDDVDEAVTILLEFLKEKNFV